MDYSDIIKDNRDNHSRVNWWPKFAFHYTDVTNAVSILDSGFLYSRLDATHMKMMRNDNASRQVIDMTNPDTISKVRFYFRPLTPTQYYNEGYKHAELRYDGDEHANTPVPIFFLFDLEKLLQQPTVSFSETSQAGRGTKAFSGVDAFSKLKFDYIYSQGFENFEEMKPYRHAEVLHSGSMMIEPFLDTVLCRNDIERTTLLNLLSGKNQLAYRKYRDKIKVYNKDVFENNGLYITDCIYSKCQVSISFSDSLNKRRYADRMKSQLHKDQLKPIRVLVIISWFKSKEMIYRTEVEANVDYEAPKTIYVTNLPDVQHAKKIGITVYFDNKLMCYKTQSIEAAEVIS